MDREFFVYICTVPAQIVVDASRCNYNQNNNIYICSFRFICISLTMNLRYFPMQRCYYFFLYLSGITIYKSHNMGSQISVSFHQNNTGRPKYKNSPGQELPPSVCITFADNRTPVRVSKMQLHNAYIYIYIEWMCHYCSVIYIRKP